MSSAPCTALLAWKKVAGLWCHQDPFGAQPGLVFPTWLLGIQSLLEEKSNRPSASAVSILSTLGQSPRRLRHQRRRQPSVGWHHQRSNLFRLSTQGRGRVLVLGSSLPRLLAAQLVPGQRQRVGQQLQDFCLPQLLGLLQVRTLKTWSNFGFFSSWLIFIIIWLLTSQLFHSPAAKT